MSLALVPSALDALAVDRGVSAGDEWVTVPLDRVRDAATALLADGYRGWCFLTCVDHLPAEPRFELVYEVRDLIGHRRLRMRAMLAGPDPVAPTISDIYPPANWDERETYDLFGIRFEGHPDLTRILLPDDWVGHPLRRDHPVGGETVDFSSDHEVWQTAPEEA